MIVQFAEFEAIKRVGRQVALETAQVHPLFSNGGVSKFTGEQKSEKSASEPQVQINDRGEKHSVTT